MKATLQSAQVGTPNVLSVIDVIKSWKESYVRNSFLSAIHRALDGEPQWGGGEAFNVFGRELHKRYLQPELPPERLTVEEELLMGAMLERLQEDPRLAKLWSKAQREKDYYATLEGVRCRITADMISQDGKHGEDIKTSACKNQTAFEKAAYKYGYFRQGAFYMAVKKLHSFTFTGIEKSSSNPGIYVVNVQDYPLWLKEGQEEYKYLLNVYKRYAKN